jgi:hypothetical protein
MINQQLNTPPAIIILAKGGEDCPKTAPRGCTRRDRVTSRQQLRLEQESQERERQESEPPTLGVITWTGQEIIVS